MLTSEIVTALYEEMEMQLNDISQSQGNHLQKAKSSSSLALQFVLRLKELVVNYQFLNKAEEVNFFKNVKPKFLCRLIYHQNLFQIHSHLPIAPALAIKDFYVNELNKINEYITKNNDFFIYYKTNQTTLDEIYFIRTDPYSWLILNFEDYETDANFTTIYDLKIAKFLALELVAEYINDAIAKMNNEPENILSKSINAKHKIRWTSSKASLIELLYAIQSAGTCNHGTIDIKILAKNFEYLFDVDLGNYYRVFQEIRIRKISRTVFLDKLKERLIQRMDQSDENPKFK